MIATFGWPVQRRHAGSKASQGRTREGRRRRLVRSPGMVPLVGVRAFIPCARYKLILGRSKRPAEAVRVVLGPLRAAYCQPVVVVPEVATLGQWLCCTALQLYSSSRMLYSIWYRTVVIQLESLQTVNSGYIFNCPVVQK